MEGSKTERELTLERELKDLQTRAATLEDENHQLKAPPKPSPPASTVPASTVQKKSWLDGGTFFHDES